MELEKKLRPLLVPGDSVVRTVGPMLYVLVGNSVGHLRPTRVPPLPQCRNPLMLLASFICLHSDLAHLILPLHSLPSRPHAHLCTLLCPVLSICLSLCRHPQFTQHLRMVLLWTTRWTMLVAPASPVRVEKHTGRQKLEQKRNDLSSAEVIPCPSGSLFLQQLSMTLVPPRRNLPCLS